MLKIAPKDDCNAMLKRCEGAISNVAGASMRIMMSHFVALLVPLVRSMWYNEKCKVWHTF